MDQMDQPVHHRWQVAAEDAGRRLDVHLAQQRPELSRSQARRALDAGQVTVNGQPQKPRYAVRAGDVIELVWQPPQPPRAVPEALALDVVYEDADLIVINKPAGMVTHPARGAPSGTLVNALLAHCRDLSGIGGELRPGIVHRLDRDTTGLIVAAKHDRAHRHLAAQLQHRTMSRQYLAVVYGDPDWTTTRVEAPIGRHPTERTRMAVVAHGRPAATRLTVLRRFSLATLVRAELDTGRTHQVRVHCTHLGHPLIGDATYGLRRAAQFQPLPEPLAEAVAALSGQALHAARLAFTHPADERPMTFEALPPPAMQRLLDELERPASGG